MVIIGIVYWLDYYLSDFFVLVFLDVLLFRKEFSGGKDIRKLLKIDNKN